MGSALKYNFIVLFFFRKGTIIRPTVYQADDLSMSMKLLIIHVFVESITKCEMYEHLPVPAM